MLNLVVLSGRLTAEPEMRVTPSQTTVVNFCLAVDKDFPKKSLNINTDFISCVAWGQNAQFISKWFHKGMLVTVVGSLSITKWEDKDGIRREKPEIDVQRQYFAEQKKGGKHGVNVNGESEIFVELDEGVGELPF